MTLLQKNRPLILTTMMICLVLLAPRTVLGNSPLFPVPPQMKISETADKNARDAGAPRALMLPVQDGVWRQVDPGGSGGTLDFAMHPADGTLLASSDMGRSLLRSSDSGRNFHAIAPEGHPTIDVLVPHPQKQGVWYAGFASPKGRGLHKSTDNADTWNLIHSDGSMARSTVFGLVIETDADDILIWGIKDQGLLISRDSGRTFTDFSRGLDKKHLYGFSKNLSARNPLLATETGNRTTVYLASANGLYQRTLSTDTAWKKIVDLPADPVTCLAHDRVRQWVWAVTKSSTLFKKDLVTGRWEKITYTASSPAPPAITLLRTHPDKPGHLWCFSHGRAGLFHTSDQGKTWQWLTRRFLTDTDTFQGNVPRDFRHRNKFSRDYFFLHPQNPDHLILGDMYLSLDGGETWQFSSTRFLEEKNSWQGTGLTLLTSYRAFWDQTNPNRVYLGFSDTGLMRTDDRGVSVKALWSSQYPDLYSLAYWSTQMLNTSGTCMAFAADPAYPATQFYAMSGKGSKNNVCGMVFKSSTDGQHWAPVMPEKSGLPDGVITDMILMDGSGYGKRTLYVAVNTIDPVPSAAIYISRDSGESFEPLADSLTMPLGFPLMSLDYCRDHPDILYAAAGTEGGKRPARQLVQAAQTSLLDGGVFRSEDRGRTWHRTGGPELAGAVQVAVHPHDPDIAWAAVVPGRGKSSAHAYAGQGGIYKTQDGGRFWENVLDFSKPIAGLGTIDADAPASVAINPVLPDIVYAAVDRAGVFRTMDGGTIWERVDWPGLKKFQSAYHTLTINPHDPAEFFVALFGNSFLAYRDPIAAHALARRSGQHSLVPNNGFELARNSGTPVYWIWNNLNHPGPEGAPILSITPAPGRKGNALQVKMDADTYQNPDFTGDNQGPITFLSTRMSPWAMSQIRGKTIKISYDIHAIRLKGPDLPILSLVETIDQDQMLLAELPAVLAYTSTPYEKTGIKKGHPLADKWMTVTTTASVSPRANALKLVLHTTAENKKTLFYIDNININIVNKHHGQ